VTVVYRCVERHDTATTDHYACQQSTLRRAGSQHTLRPFPFYRRGYYGWRRPYYGYGYRRTIMAMAIGPITATAVAIDGPTIVVGGISRNARE
jgi:hypothetical protein